MHKITTKRVMLQRVVYVFQIYTYMRLYTQRNIFGILLYQTEIRLFLPFSDLF